MAEAIFVSITFLLVCSIPDAFVGCMANPINPDAAPPLGNYGGDASAVSVSGLSSGSYMAVQLHVAYSKSIMGVGAVAGGPFYCAKANLLIAVEACMVSPDKIDVDYLEQVTKNTVSTGTIDGVENMNGDRIYMFGASLDTVVVQGVVQKLENYYSRFITTNTLKTEYSIPAEHSMVTDNYGNPCTHHRLPYINKCGYNTAFELLNHIYDGSLQRPTGDETVTGDFLEFDQQEFVPDWDPSKASMDATGYVYVPSGCRSTSSNCKVHVSIHGCLQGRQYIGNTYAMHTGYNEIAELNNIIVIYPQAVPTAQTNPSGCWDWWGYIGLDYASNVAPQMKAIKAMIDRVLS